MKQLGLILLLAIGATEARADEIYQDFRGKDVDEQLFRLQGPDAALRIKSEPQGLRITMPPDPKGPATVGLGARFHLKGDFEITVGYEILQAELPTMGQGVGLEIYLNTDTPTNDALVFQRIARPAEGEIYLCDRRTTNAGKRGITRRNFPTDSKLGHLRLTRKGTEVTFWAAEGAGEKFHDLCRHDLGAMDFGVSIRAFSGGQKLVDIRITDVRIRDRSEPIPAKDGGPKATQTWRLWLVAGLFGTGLIVAGLLWTWRRRAGRGIAKTAKPSDSVSFFCSSCGKHLQTSAGSAGKTVKCPGCGQAGLVPGTTSGGHTAGPR